MAIKNAYKAPHFLL